MARLDPKVHREFHGELRTELRQRGLDLPIGGKTGSTKAWARYFAESGPDAQAKALEAVLAASAKIDLKHEGVQLTEIVWLNILGGKFKAVAR